MPVLGQKNFTAFVLTKAYKCLNSTVQIRSNKPATPYAEGSMPFSLPSQGFVFWPVGCGDSTTIVVNKTTLVQVDLNHLGISDDDDDPHAAVIDELCACLPKVSGKPYLPVFILTHPDLDHCKGFKRLLEEVTIGEIWFSPRVFWEYTKDLCEDAQAFKVEAKRRVQVTIKDPQQIKSGDRVRIVGYDDLLQKDEYKGFPPSLLSIPGTRVTMLDGVSYAEHFSAFIHAPFKDDLAGERNDTSIALQISLHSPGASGKTTGRVLLFGDLCYPTLKKIFELSQPQDLAWDMMLCPHHCSKSVMYVNDELKQDILDAIEKAAGTVGYIVASCKPIPSSNEKGENPPHAIAADRYKEIAPSGFIVTHEFPNKEAPEPLVFELTDSGFVLRQPAGTKNAVPRNDLSSAIAVARGSSEPPTDRVGFGNVIE
jgi:beta-lactamase superfamily II metal-dependent hydrolase